MERRQVTDFFELKEVSEDGTFTGIASVTGIEDLQGDVLDRNAFSKTLKENPVVPILWQHDTHEVIGKGVVRQNGDKILVEGKLDLADPMAEKAYGKMKRKLITGLSIGFSAIKSTWQEVGGRAVRHISELKLWEISAVTFPALPEAQITAVKSMDQASIARCTILIGALRNLLQDGTRSIERINGGRR